MTYGYNPGKFCSFRDYAIDKLDRYLSLTLQIIQGDNLTQLESIVSFDQIYKNHEAVPPDENISAKMPYRWLEDEF